MKTHIAGKTILGAFAVVTLLLAACGEDSSSSPSNDVVENDSVLGICGKSNFGEIKSKNPAEHQAGDTTYYCSTVGWIDATHWSWDVPKEARLNPNIDYGSMTDGRDGQTYKTVVIGTQTWMAENLNYDYKIGGESYGSWCYGDTAKYCVVTGRMYTWAAAMDTATTGCGDGKTCTASAGRAQGICPNGWHLPDTAEWSALFAAVGGTSTAGVKLVSASGWTTALVGADDYGFSALPSGDRSGGNYYHAGTEAEIWSSSESGTGLYVEVMSLDCDVSSSGFEDKPKGKGYAVRCLKD